MKGFLVLLVLSAAGLAGVLYWRKSLQEPKAPVVTAAAPAKAGKQKQRRKRHGARRLSRNEILARNDVFVGSSSPDEAPPAYDTAQAYAQKPRSREPEPERAPLAPGGASTTEVPPEDVFGDLTPPSSAAHAPSGGARQAPEPEPIKLRAGDLKIVWQGEDLSKAETQHLDLSNEGGHDLTEAEIDARFRTKEDAVLACINRARPDEYTDIPGRVTVRFRIQRTGTVKGVQVEAPVILHKGGLLGCMRGVVGGLKFPVSSGSQVISYPYSLM
jgi:hypothetical protein